MCSSDMEPRQGHWLLTLGSYPQEMFPQLMVTFVRYPTVAGVQSAAGERFLDNVTVEGPIP
jgi:ATP-dependent DNA helicase RecG